MDEQSESDAKRMMGERRGGRGERKEGGKEGRREGREGGGRKD